MLHEHSDHVTIGTYSDYVTRVTYRHDVTIETYRNYVTMYVQHWAYSHFETWSHTQLRDLLCLCHNSGTYSHYVYSDYVPNLSMGLCLQQICDHVISRNSHILNLGNYCVYVPGLSMWLYLCYTFGTLQHIAAHCNTLQHTATHNTLQHVICVLQCVAISLLYLGDISWLCLWWHTATHCNTHCNTQLTISLLYLGDISWICL